MILRPKSLTVVCLSIALCLASATADEGKPQDPLWQKAVASARANRDWVPGLVDVCVEVLNARGKPKHVMESRMRVTLGEDGEPEANVLTILVNGKDVTAEHKKQGKADKQSAADFEFEQEARLFDPETQQQLTVTSTGEKRVIGGKNCITYQFLQTIRKGVVLKGNVWLEEKTGSPVEIQLTAGPLPRNIEQMVTTVRYESPSLGSWYPNEMVIDCTASFLFIFKKRIRTVMRFSNYWKHAKTDKTQAQ